MQQYSLRIKSYRTFPKNDNLLSKIAKERLEKLKTFEMLQQEGVRVDVALRAVHLTRPTLYRWRAALRQSGPRGLEPASTRPKRTRQSQWTLALERQVLALRKQFPLWGKKTLATLLRRDYGLTVPKLSLLMLATLLAL